MRRIALFLALISVVCLQGCGGGGSNNPVSSNGQIGGIISTDSYVLRFRVSFIDDNYAVSHYSYRSAQRTAESVVLAHAICQVTGDGIAEPMIVEGDITDSNYFELSGAPPGKARIITCDIFSLSGEKIRTVSGLADVPYASDFVFEVSPTTTKAVEIFRKLKTSTQLNLRWQAIVEFLKNRYQQHELDDVPVDDIANAIEQCIEEGLSPDELRAGDIEEKVSSPSPITPVLSYSPASLSFNDPDNTCGWISLENVGDGLLTSNIIPNQTWISVSLSSFQLDKNEDTQIEVCVSVVRGQQLSGQVKLESNGGDGSVNITTVFPAESDQEPVVPDSHTNTGSAIVVSPTSLDFGTYLTHDVLMISYMNNASRTGHSVSTVATASFTVVDGVRLTVSTDKTWLTVGQSSLAVIAGETSYLDVYVNRDGYEDGSHSGNVILSGSGISTVNVPVEMEVPFEGGPITYRRTQVYAGYSNSEGYPYCYDFLIPGDNKEFSIAVRNEGEDTVYGVTGHISMSPEDMYFSKEYYYTGQSSPVSCNVNIEKDELVYGDIEPGYQYNAMSNAIISIPDNGDCSSTSGITIPFTLTLTDQTGRRWSINSKVSVTSPYYRSLHYCSGTKIPISYE